MVGSLDVITWATLHCPEGYIIMKLCHFSTCTGKHRVPYTRSVASTSSIKTVAAIRASATTGVMINRSGAANELPQ